MPALDQQEGSKEMHPRWEGRGKQAILLPACWLVSGFCSLMEAERFLFTSTHCTERWRGIASVLMLCSGLVPGLKGNSFSRSWDKLERYCWYL